MTLVEFISSVCVEVLKGEKTLHHAQEIQPKTTVITHSTLITESKLQQMIQNNTVGSLTDSSRFTPLARDLYHAYLKKNKK